MKLIARDLIVNSTAFSRERDVPRSEGTHLSTIIQAIVARSPGSKHDEWDEDELEGVRTPGFVWERAMGEHAREVNPQLDLVYPGEMFWCRECDDYFNGVDEDGVNPAGEHCAETGHRGIYFTPDAVLRPGSDLPPHVRWRHRRKLQSRVVEWKYTWMSSKRAYNVMPDGSVIVHLDGLQKWVWQLGWACPCFGTRLAQVQVMFSRGDYSSSRPKVDAKCIDIEFLESDLRRVKAMIISNAVAERLL